MPLVVKTSHVSDLKSSCQELISSKRDSSVAQVGKHSHISIFIVILHHKQVPGDLNAHPTVECELAFLPVLGGPD